MSSPPCIVLAYSMMLRCDVGHIRRSAAMQDDGRFLLLLLTALGAFASLAAIVFELGASKGNRAGLTLAIVTIVLSWAIVHTAFSLHYAHEFYRNKKPGGLQFPSGDTHAEADYWDFVYFSFVIGMSAQVSDVGITDKIIRRTATVHGIISFVFNTTLIALMVNIAGARSDHLAVPVLKRARDPFRQDRDEPGGTPQAANTKSRKQPHAK